MQTFARFLAAASMAGTIAGFANADMVELTSEEVSQVTQACRIGLPLIPVSSDFGFDTGEYALPLSGQNGDVHSALIVSETALREIPECKAEIDALAEAENRGSDSLS